MWSSSHFSSCMAGAALAEGEAEGEAEGGIERERPLLGWVRRHIEKHAR